ELIKYITDIELGTKGKNENYIPQNTNNIKNLKNNNKSQKNSSIKLSNQDKKIIGKKRKFQEFTIPSIVVDFVYGTSTFKTNLLNYKSTASKFHKRLNNYKYF